MSIDYIQKSLETMRYFEKASISETFSNGGTDSYTVHYIHDNLQYEVQCSANEEIILFDSVEAASEWIHIKTNSPATQN
ncbi:hypothetical protein [Planococcus halotolerans]|uniref:DUF1797 domain-containing protein n=1 Tax=Planococcus halotolerans TaxID=2233542 RepID=A0A365L1U3_9BACL|nr:hypothetical protein [Planococcus halotolerans]QHJ71074.1 hypothetical protein DNR44_010815 [Planococcus halotolerans]RAZ79165.1 hypothetical protein DP120_05980 [Planococcus halotolerans]